MAIVEHFNKEHHLAPILNRDSFEEAMCGSPGKTEALTGWPARALLKERNVLASGGGSAHDVVGALPLLFDLQFERDIVAFDEHIAKAGIFHITLVKKYILSALGGDKTEALDHVKKFYSALHHTCTLSNENNRKTPECRAGRTGASGD